MAGIIIDSHVHVGRNEARWDETRPMLEALGIDTAVLAADGGSASLDGDRGLPGVLSRPGGPFALWYIGGEPFSGIEVGPAELPRDLEDYQGIEWHCWFSAGYDYGSGADEVAAAEAEQLLGSEAARTAWEGLDEVVERGFPIRLTESLPVTVAIVARYPQATFIVPHMGLRNGGTARVMRALARNEQVYFDTSAVEPDEALVRRVSAARVLFGSDAPAGDVAWALRGVRALDVPADDLALILGGNAERLFGAA
jgi:Amidohydrolase